jgi:hypothetical protein
VAPKGQGESPDTDTDSGARIHNTALACTLDSNTALAYKRFKSNRAYCVIEQRLERAARFAVLPSRDGKVHPDRLSDIGRAGHVEGLIRRV